MRSRRSKARRSFSRIAVADFVHTNGSGLPRHNGPRFMLAARRRDQAIVPIKRFDTSDGVNRNVTGDFRVRGENRNLISVHARQCHRPTLPGACCGRREPHPWPIGGVHRAEPPPARQTGPSAGHGLTAHCVALVASLRQAPVPMRRRTRLRRSGRCRRPALKETTPAEDADPADFCNEIGQLRKSTPRDLWRGDAGDYVRCEWCFIEDQMFIFVAIQMAASPSMPGS
jgi:hypothetical protein